MQEDDDEPTITLSDDDLDALEEEIPLLRGVRAFAEAATRLPWFSAAGEPLDRDTRNTARTYLDGLGFPDVDVARLGDWTDAADAAQSLDYDTAQWEAEESLRAGLASEALEHISEDALAIALTHVSALLGERIGAAAREAAAEHGIDDEELLNAAAGAAVQAAHGVALTLIAEADDDHPFRHKFALFARGHWPIGIAGLTFNIL
ncbi:MAG TPA: hypothetical protein VF449_12325 [Parvibaculum sp.]